MTRDGEMFRGRTERIERAERIEKPKPPPMQSIMKGGWQYRVITEADDSWDRWPLRICILIWAAVLVPIWAGIVALVRWGW